MDMLSPLPASKWNYTTAAHLLNRAGFGGTPLEIERLVHMGHESAVSYFVDYENVPDSTPPPEWAKADPDEVDRYAEIRRMERNQKNLTDEEKKTLEEKRRAVFQEDQRTQIKRLMELRGSWLERMAYGPRPLQEKMVLFWHGHFATSAQKVRIAYFMWRQLQTFRDHATGNWLEMLDAVAKDPAMLIWLDQAQSRREHPNENFAREVMELFALGEGHYTEKDITEAARAMTGWSLDRQRQEYVYRPGAHDPGFKTFLGETGNLTGRDVLEIISEQPQTGLFMCAKLWKFFASEEPDPKLIDQLAYVFRTNGSTFKPMLRAMLMSEEFYAEGVIRTQVKSPVQWLVSSVRMLDRDLPPPVVCDQLTRNLGQELLAPPNVKGWDGGLSWITTNNLLSRYNEAAVLVLAEGNIGGGAGQGIDKMIAQRAQQMTRQMRAINVDKIVSPENRTDKKKLLTILEKRFLADKLTERQRSVLHEYLNSRKEIGEQEVRHAIRLIMATPEYQLT